MIFLYFLCLITILFGIFVIISKNPIVSVLFLILLFSSVASYLILLDLTFIGLSYIIVYIGAVSILFLFILMLINVRTSELQSYTKNSLNLAIITGLVFNYLFSLLDETSKYGNIYINTYNNIEEFIKNTWLKTLFSDFPLLVTSQTWDKNLIENTNISSIGNIMYTTYNLWLIITTYILLLAMVGAIVITIKQKD